MDVVHDAVKELAEKELLAANERFPLFTSAHEGYGVLLEEVDETADAVAVLRAELNSLWNKIKQNEPVAAGEVYNAAAHTAGEAIQVAAMALKMAQSMDAGWKGGKAATATAKTKPEPARLSGGCCDYATPQCQCRTCKKCTDIVGRNDKGELGCCDVHDAQTHDTKDGRCCIKNCPDYVKAAP